MEAVSPDDILAALRSALEDAERGLGDRGLSIGDEQLRLIATAAAGHVRRGLTLLEIAAELAGEEVAGQGGGVITDAILEQVLADRTRRLDKVGEQFYEQISALQQAGGRSRENVGEGN